MNHVPPHSIDAEQALLGGLLMDSRASRIFADLADKLTGAEFYTEEHRALWGAMQALAEADKPIDLLTVMEQLGAGVDRAYLGELAGNASGASNARHYAEIVRDKWLLRQNLEAGLDIQRKALSGATAAEVGDFAQQRVMEIGSAKEGGPSSAADALRRWLPDFDERCQAPGELRGLPSGLADLDRMTLGFRPGQMIVVAGRPGSGKTAFALNLATNIAFNGAPVLVFEMEMSEQELIERGIASIGRVPLRAIQEGTDDPDEMMRITTGAKRLQEAPLYIDDTPGLAVAQMLARARRLKAQHGLGAVVVDYIGLAEGKGENRNVEITNISRGLKKLAKSLQVPVIALSQLSRKCEERQDKRPIMSDLRESGSIEQDADLIAFLYRDEYYREADENDPRHGIAELIVAKQRNGRTGKIYLTFLGEIQRFENCTDEAEQRYRSAMTASPGKLRKAAGFDDL